MMEVRKSGFLWIIPLLIAICLVGVSAQAKTSHYIFLSEKSTLIQTGGIAGIDRTYTITGAFQLTTNFRTGTALFLQVEADAFYSTYSRGGSTDHYRLNPNEVFNMTSLTGTIVAGGESIRFDGTADDGSNIQITLTHANGSVSLKGETVPPPSSTDFFIYTIDAIAKPKYEYSGGSGTTIDPYQITTVADLIALGENPLDYDKHFILTADIDLDAYLPGRKIFDKAVIPPVTNLVAPWSEIGFTGSFDGHGYKISHLTIIGDCNLGLFGQLEPQARIFNLGLKAVDVNGTGGCVGGLVGKNRGLIDKCYSTGMVSGDASVGGLVGINTFPGSISSSYNTAIVTCTGAWVVGGLIGDNYGGSITTSYSTGRVTGNSIVGGLVGRNVSSGDIGNGIITSSYCIGAVHGTSEVGGLVGRSSGGSINSSFWDIETSGKAASAGGNGLTTAEMQTVSSYLKAGWDFVDETENGIEDIWKISEGLNYPCLWWEKYSGGSGTAEDPYQIATVEDLMDSPDDYDKHFILTADIDLDPNLPGRKVFERAFIHSFTGVFDGNGHIISNLRIDGGSYLGMFGQLDYGATIKNMGLDNVYATGTGDYVSGLVGENRGDVTQCYTTGIVGGRDNVSGLVGSNSGAVIACYSTGMVSGTSGVGGLLGSNWGTVNDCYSTVTVSGNGNVGGLVGENSGDVTDCYSRSEVSGGYCIGGLVGYSYRGYVTDCYSTGSVSGGDVVGGLVGGNLWEGMFYLQPEYHLVTNCYSTGSVSGDSRVGGLVGYNRGTITNCYSTGSVSGNELIGGLVGDNAEESVTACFWDIQTSGQASSDGGTGKTTAEMQTASTFLEAGWDFIDETENGIEDIWWIDEGQDYPRLWWERPTDDLFFLVVDDFENYNDLDEGEPGSNRIYLTWVDGFDTPEINGSIVGYTVGWGILEHRIVHGGLASMPYSYDNAVGISEATASMDNLEIDPDWTVEGVRVLSLWFRGTSANAPEPMYVALANDDGTIGVSYHDNPNAALIEKWIEWTIDLTQFANQGVDLTNIDIISIGFGYKNDPQAGGEGHVKFDDIRLYRPPWPIWPVPVDPVLPPIWPIRAPIEPVLPPTWPRPVPPLDPGFFPPNELWPIPVKP